MLHDILTAINSTWHFIVHTFQGLRILVVTGINSLGIVQEVLNWLPAVISGFCIGTILLLLLKFLMGRD